EQKVEKKAEQPKEQPKPKPEGDQRALRREYDSKMKQFQKLEGELTKLKEEKIALEAKLATPEVYANAAEFSKLDAAYRALDTKMTTLNADYEKAMEAVLELEEKLG